MKRFFTIATIALSFISCGENGSLIPEPTPPVERIPINISTSITRATDSAFEAGDKVGIFVVNEPNTLAASGNYVDNMGFTYSGQWAPDEEIFWKDQTTKADFYCYYPYAESVNTKAHTFATKADQSTLANYKASEFLWGKTELVTPTADVVPITVNHKLSNAIVIVEPGNGYTAESLATSDIKVKIANVKTEMLVNLATGAVEASGVPTTVTPLNEGTYYRALIVPQTVPEDALIIVTVDGVTYTLVKAFKFEANTQHCFTVKVNKVNNGVNIGIGGWVIDDTDNGGSVE